MINCARVCIRMPSFGDMWFFIDEKTTTQDLKTQCQKEDTLISTIEILKEGGAVKNSDIVYNLLQTRQPLFLMVNNIRYQFDTADPTPPELQIQVTDKNPFFVKSVENKMTNLQANTVSTIAKLVIQNMGAAASKEQLTKTFIQSAQFFSHSIIREHLYTCQSQRMILQAEY